MSRTSRFEENERYFGIGSNFYHVFEISITLNYFSGIKMQGYLSKKSEKNKKWKSLYFVLICFDGNSTGGGAGTGGSTDTHLCFYENPKVIFRRT